MRNFCFLLMVFGLFLASSRLNAEEAPLYQGDVQEWEKSMLTYVSNWQNVADRSREDFRRIRNDLEEVIELNPKRPRLYIVAGWLHGYDAGLIIAELKKSGLSREERGKNPEYLDAIEKANESFIKAMEFDQDNLSLNELELINSAITKSDTKVKNYRNMLRLWDQGERYEENDNADPVINFEYKTYSKIVTAYVDEKRYDEALAVIDEMSGKFSAMKSEIQAGREQLLNRQKSEKERMLEQVKEPPLTARPEKQDKLNKVKLEKAIKESEVKASDVSSKGIDGQVFYWAFGILILLIVRMTLMRRR